MTAVAISGDLGVSTHEKDAAVDARGRRLAFKTLVRPALCCDARTTDERALAVVGDVGGALSRWTWRRRSTHRRSGGPSSRFTRTRRQCARCCRARLGLPVVVVVEGGGARRRWRRVVQRRERKATMRTAVTRATGAPPTGRRALRVAWPRTTAGSR